MALLLSPDGGTQRMRLYIGEKGKDSDVFDFDLVFTAGFDPAASSFRITKISDTSGDANSLGNPDWLALPDAAGYDGRA